jgi:Arc/MetJ-type ribon-helix-helix transcriptional regulator
MVDSIVSIRMPSSLVQELKTLSKEKHFLDVSEQMRSIIRIKTQEYRIKTGDKKEERIAKQTTEVKQEALIKEQLVKRLKEMIKELEHEN